LSDLDLYGLFSQTAWGRNSLSLKEFNSWSDRQTAALLSITFDDEGRLVTESERNPRGVPSGSIAAALRELPAPATLGFSDEETRWALTQKANIEERYWAMFCQVWANRKRSKEEIKALWTAHLASEN
jgi:hypothetical protein